MGTGEKGNVTCKTTPGWQRGGVDAGVCRVYLVRIDDDLGGHELWQDATRGSLNHRQTTSQSDRRHRTCISVDRQAIVRDLAARRRQPNAGSRLGQRRRRWPSLDPPLCQRLLRRHTNRGRLTGACKAKWPCNQRLHRPPGSLPSVEETPATSGDISASMWFQGVPRRHWWRRRAVLRAKFINGLHFWSQNYVYL